MPETIKGFVSGVRLIVERRVRRIARSLGHRVDVELLMPGKMLRTRLAARLADAAARVNPVALRSACAATELVHTASLFHDDVLDNATIRRDQPALWQAAGPSGAILVGDLLFCEAVQLIVEADSSRYLRPFLAKVRQVVEAEAEHELVLRGKRVDAATCLRLARGKTGPLFAFTALICGGEDKALCEALEEAGYRIGTAYQLADDLLDLVGAEDAAGKTLGTDCRRGKFTLPQAGDEGGRITRDHVSELCASAMASLGPYPQTHAALRRFLVRDLQPIFRRHDNRLALCMELTA